MFQILLLNVQMTELIIITGSFLFFTKTFEFKNFTQKCFTYRLLFWANNLNITIPYR